MKHFVTVPRKSTYFFFLGALELCIEYSLFLWFFTNSGAALVMIYRDGSVLVTHGGTEMGQVSPSHTTYYIV